MEGAIFVLVLFLLFSNGAWCLYKEGLDKKVKQYKAAAEEFGAKYNKLLRVCTTLSATNKKLRKEAKPAKYKMVPVCPCGKPAEQKVEHGKEVMHFCKECVNKLELEKVT